MNLLEVVNLIDPLSLSAFAQDSFKKLFHLAK